MESLLRSGLSVWHAVAGSDTSVERALKDRYKSAVRRIENVGIVRQYKAIKSKFQRQYLNENFAIFWSGPQRENRIGIYTLGSCDLPSVFGCIPLIRPVLNGTCCIIREGLISDARSDVLLQTLQEVPQEHLAPLFEKLRISGDYFQPRLFEKYFTVPGPTHPEEFPKKLVILSIAADVTRTIYRHKEHGFLADPGGYWLKQPMDKVLGELPTVTWFRQNFRSVSKLSVEEFVNNFARVVQLVKNKTGAPVMVFNVLTIDPGSMTHCYQFVKDPPNMRRREFNLALVELSRKLDFPIVDVDRVLKKAGISKVQVDFSHFPIEAYRPIAQEAFGVMRELRVF